MRGSSEQVGGPLDLYDRPANRFVAGFLGSPAMSFIEGTLDRSESGAAVLTPAGIRIPAPPTDAPSGAAVELGIRPEDFRIAPGESGIPFLVDTVEPTGSEIHLHGTIDSAEARCVFRERLQVRPGDRLPLGVDPARTHLFDRNTGMRL
jgi:multiple sugar transport system ATP-binding protein